VDWTQIDEGLRLSTARSPLSTGRGTIEAAISPPSTPGL